MTAHDEQIRQLARNLDARFSRPEPLAAQADAAKAATTRDQRALQLRNEDVRAALGKLDGTEAGRAACLALMSLSVYSQCMLLNTAAPTLLVGAS